MADAREIDDVATRLVARARVVVFTIMAIAAAASLGEGSTGVFQYPLTMVLLPAAVALAFTVERVRPTVAAALGAGLDVAAAAVGFLAFPDSAGTVGSLFLVAVMTAGYTGGRWLGIAAGGTALATLAVEDAVGEVSLAGEVSLLLAAGVAASVAIVGRTDARLRRSSRWASYHAARASVFFERMAEPIVVTNASGRVTKLNAAATSLLRPEPGNIDCGRLLGVRIDGHPVDCTQRCGLSDVAASRSSGGVEAVLCPADRDPIPVLVSLAEVEPADEAADPEFVHTVRDITALKRADDAKTMFLATATHELKTPLTVIRGFLDLFDNPAIDAETRALALSTMRHRADELNAIIERVLLASRIESGKLAVETGDVDVVAVACDRVSSLATATGRTITLDAGSAPPAAADETAVATVLDHLLDNACKYSTGDDPVTVTIRADEAAVRVGVQDRGGGMTPDQRERCFDRFWQADPTSRRRVGGTGIGLYIVRSLVESMGGAVTVTSKLGEGSTFTFTLPRADLAAAQDGERSTPPPPEREPSIVREFMRQIGVPSSAPPERDGTRKSPTSEVPA